MDRPRNTRQGEDDAILIAQILSGSDPTAVDTAYRRLVERYWTVVTVRVRGRVGSERDAEDIAQEAFIRAFRALDKLENPRLFLGWLLRIGQNLATDHLRRRRNESSLEGMGIELVDRRMSSAERVQKRLDQQEELERVLAAIPRIPDSYQNVLVLRYLEGYSNSEIARRLDEPEGTIRNRLFRALRKVRALLEGKATVNP